MALNTIGEIETNPGANSRELSAHYLRTASQGMRHARTLYNLGLEADADKLVIDSWGDRLMAGAYALRGYVQTKASAFGVNLG